MTDEFQLINHCLFKGILVFFVMREELRREQVERCLTLLHEMAHVTLSEEEISAYWRGIQERLTGNARWDNFAPMVDPKQDFVRYALSFNDIDKIPLKRPYKSFSISGIRYLLEVFNPKNELGIDYPGAGQAVLALIMKDEKAGYIEDKLIENTDFYEIVKKFASISDADAVVGMNSGNLASLMRAYYDRSIDASTDPWSFLYPLQVMKLPKPVGDVSLKRYCKKVEDWGDGRLLLQVKNGIDFTINQQNVDAAKLLGMTPVQSLNPDIMKKS